MMSIARALVAAACTAVATLPVHAQPAGGEAAPVAGPPLAVRIEWGGGKPRAWLGEISIVSPRPPASAGPVWRLLSRDADASATVHAEAATLHVHDPRPRTGNGVEVDVEAWADARIVVRLRDVGGSRGDVEVAVKDLFAAPATRVLDTDGNRLTVAIADGGGLRVDFGDAARSPAAPLFRPGDTVRLAVHPVLMGRVGAAAAREIVLRVRDEISGVELPPQSRHMRPAGGVPLAEGNEVQAYDAVAFEIVLPDRETAWSVSLTAIERGSLGWSRPLVSRTLGIAAIAEQMPAAPAAEWSLVHELDPGSPRLHERLRRLPGVPSIPVPAVTMPSLRLPSLPLPSMSRPPVSLPKLPNVPLPSVSSIVPRISGLLASGHSSIEPHSLGPMLVLPPSRSLDEPSWEGIVVAGVAAGMPHLVEIEFPRDQDAVFGVSVLETDDRGAVVQCRHAGGFEVTRPIVASGGASGLGRHSFVLWPSTRNPLVLITNASTRNRASFGKVRVFAGPARVPVMRVAESAGPTGSSRGVHACFATPDGLAFGAGGSQGASSPRLPDEWLPLLRGVRRSADWLTAQDASGALVAVYAQGGALWPSSLTLEAPRWFDGAGPGGKDLLGLLCRAYAGAGLKLVAGMTFDAPLPAIESALGSATADEKVGVALVGRDGRPRRLTNASGSTHYNILDPRVQDAVAALVADLVARLHGERAAAGVAVLLSHEGWLHFPGVAWGLDDATFARFAAASGIATPPAGADRHGQRATLVEGPLREAWLAWRAREVAAFYERLADLVASGHPQCTLYVAPTTLFAAGDLAGLFRPQLAGHEPDADVWREIGFDPAALTASGRIVLLSPHVHATSDGLVDRCTVDNANRSLGVARGVAAARRRGVIAVEMPIALAVRDVVPHGPFGTAVADGPVATHAVRSGPAQSRALAESLVAADAEVIFDMGFLYAQPTLESVTARRAFGSLPCGALGLVDPLPAPLVVRAGRTAHGAAALVVNASDVPFRASLSLAGEPQVVADAVDGAQALPPGGRAAEVMLEPWGVRVLAMDGHAAVTGARVEFDERVRGWVAERLSDLERKRAAVEQPVPCDVLDNPDFDLPQSDGAVTGWELVEPRRGSLAIVANDRDAGGWAVAFSSVHGLSTLRSNPFPPPATGRISVAMWLRLAAGDQQPPLRIAVEGLEDDREYYRFAPVGGLAGGKPLGPAWTQFVLQIDDLPPRGLESLRVRLDLLGPGAVQVDGIRVFDLAFDERQRVQLTRMLADVEQRLAADDVGRCVLALDSYWPKFLAMHVPAGAADTAGAAANQPGGQPMARPPSKWTWR